MTAKPVIPTRLARQDVEDELTHYLVDEGSEQAALGFIVEIERAYARLSRHPNIGSPRYAFELDVPGLRSWPLDRYPHLISTLSARLISKSGACSTANVIFRRGWKATTVSFIDTHPRDPLRSDR
jgi:toxin ParE1/3/4